MLAAEASTTDSPPPQQQQPPPLVLRIYDRESGLTPHAQGRRAEDDGPVDGLVPGALAWATDGSLIATARARGGGGGKKGGGVEVAFFERNGLRHREFVLREEDHMKVAALAWDAEAGVLAVALRPPPSSAPGEGAAGRVQLWHRGNYHWYLKQELRFAPSSLTALRFDAERPRRLHLLLLQHQQPQQQLEWRTLDYAWDALVSPSPLRTAAVIDGRRLLLTPLAKALVPPPMAAATLTAASGPVVAVGFMAQAAPLLRYRPLLGGPSEEEEQAPPAPPPAAVMAVLTSAGVVELFDERVAVAVAAAGSPAGAGALLGSVAVGVEAARQVVVLVEGQEGEEEGAPLRLRLLLAAWDAERGADGVLEVSGVAVQAAGGLLKAGEQQHQERFLPLPSDPSSSSSSSSIPRIMRLCPWGPRCDAALLALDDGRLLHYSTATGALAPHPHLPPLLEPCPWVALLLDDTPHHHPIAIGLSERGRLYANEHCLAPGGCGSFLLHPTFGALLFATLGSRPQLRLVPYRALAALDAHAGAETLWGGGEAGGGLLLEPRALERGARLVAASPWAATVVVQVGCWWVLGRNLVYRSED